MIIPKDRSETHQLYNILGKSCFSLGLASMTVPIYLAECSPIHLRGRLTVADNMAVTGGQFVAGVVDYAFSYVSHGWRYIIEFDAYCFD